MLRFKIYLMQFSLATMASSFLLVGMYIRKLEIDNQYATFLLSLSMQELASLRF